MFRLIKDGGINNYNTEKTNIQVENRVDRIDKTSKFDMDGMPAYIVRSRINLAVSDREDIG